MNLDNRGQKVEELVSLRLKEVSPQRAALEKRVCESLSRAVERTSWDGCRFLGSYLGLAFFAAGKRRRELAVSNIQMALGFNRAQAMRVARRSAQNWGMTTCEFLHLPAATGSEIRNYVKLEGLEHLQSALDAGRGALIMTAHVGNWELLAARLAQEFSLDAIARPVSNATVQGKIAAIRRTVGLTLFSKHNAARPTLTSLKRGRGIIILPDRHAGTEGVVLPLFGKETRFEGAPARFSAMTGASIVPSFGFRRGPWLANGHITGRISPGFVVECASREDRVRATLDGSRQVISALEGAVREHPDQWSWMLRRWRDDDSSKK